MIVDCLIFCFFFRERCTELHNKILAFYKDLNNVSGLIKILEAETKLESEVHQDRIYCAWKTIVQVLMEIDTEDYLDLVISLLLPLI